MDADLQDAPRHAGQVVRREVLRRNIAVDPETAQLVAAAVQAPGAPRVYLLARNGARNGMAGVSGYLAGRKRNADQVPSIDTWRTGCTPWPASAATSRSRLRSVPSWPPFG